jgi:hypothetical protein
MQSIIARIIISALIVLPRMPSALLSADSGLMYQVKDKIQNFSVSIGSGTSSVMSKSLPFVVEAALEGSNIPVCCNIGSCLINTLQYLHQAQKEIGLLLHPRMPPLVRSMPHVESFSLFKAEEPQDEAEALSTLGLTYLHPSQPQIVQDTSMTGVSMTTDLTTAPRDSYPTQNFRDSILPMAEPTEQISVIPINSSPTQTKPSNMLESARSTIGLHSTAADSDDTGGPSTIMSKTVLFSKEDEQDEDEEMPFIDIDSDSEDEATD